jgi:hypothetical protein
MKLFSVSLHEGAKKWDDNLPGCQHHIHGPFEEVFLAKWALKLEDVQSLLKEIEGIKQGEL